MWVSRGRVCGFTAAGCGRGFCSGMQECSSLGARERVGLQEGVEGKGAWEFGERGDRGGGAAGATGALVERAGGKAEPEARVAVAMGYKVTNQCIDLPRSAGEDE